MDFHRAISFYSEEFRTCRRPRAISASNCILARGEEDEEQSILRLGHAAEALHVGSERLFALRRLVAEGRGPVFHPMHDDGLDPQVEDALQEWLETADTAAGIVIRELQKRIGNQG